MTNLNTHELEGITKIVKLSTYDNNKYKYSNLRKILSYAKLYKTQYFCTMKYYHFLTKFQQEYISKSIKMLHATSC